MKRTILAATMTGVVALAGCTAADPMRPAGTDADSGDTINIGTANFPESEIIGQVWAETLREAGFDVEVTSGIGSREVYTSAIEEGTIDLIPEYIGSLAQFYDADVPDGAGTGDVVTALESVLPEGLAIAAVAPGENKDAFQVLPGTAAEHDLVTLGDMANLGDITLATQPETAERAFNPEGLEQVYGVPADAIGFNLISDGGGPLTVAALVAGEANVANIYTTTPSYDNNGERIELVTLEDPLGIILPENVTPLHRTESLPPEAVDVLDEVNADLTTGQLIEFNERNNGPEKAEPSTIAADFVGARG